MSTQVAEVVEDKAKLTWLTEHLPRFVDQGDVLVFASQKLRVDDLTNELKAGGFRCLNSILGKHAHPMQPFAPPPMDHTCLAATGIMCRPMAASGFVSGMHL